jgi:hypothetical protein
MEQKLEKFATQVDAATLATIKNLAKEEGRQIQALVNEALNDLVEKKKNASARPHVMSAYMNSHSQYASLYKKLAE